MKVLLVEDDSEVVALLSTALELEGHTVLTAADGAEALRALRADAPDIIVLDLWMPVMNGWEFMSRLRCLEDPALRELPVIAMSADVNVERDGLPIEAFFPKPLDIPRLLAATSGKGETPHPDA